MKNKLFSERWRFDPSICSSVYLFFHLSAGLSIRLSISLLICLSVYPFSCLLSFTLLSIPLSFQLFICLTFQLFIHPLSLSIWGCIFPCICSSVYPTSIHSVHTIHLAVFPSIYAYILLSMNLYIQHFIHLFIYVSIFHLSILSLYESGSPTF